MSTNNQELLRSQNLSEEPHKQNSSDLIERYEIEGTPFTLIKQEGKYFLTMGNYKITTPTDTEEETLKKLVTEQYNIILDMTTIVFDTIMKIRENGMNNNNNNKNQ